MRETIVGQQVKISKLECRCLNSLPTTETVGRPDDGWAALITEGEAREMGEAEVRTLSPMSPLFNPPISGEEGERFEVALSSRAA